MTPDAGEAAGDLLAPFGLPLRIPGAIDQPGDDLSCVDAEAEAPADDAEAEEPADAKEE